MKFDFVIGNPPYQDETIGDNKGFAPPVYDKFLEEAYKVADVVEMIHPARFLFNAGSTPKAWNEKMLRDTHFKVLMFEADSKKVFQSKAITGGIAITYHDNSRDFGAIGVFTQFNELNSILNKAIKTHDFKTMSNIVVTRTIYRLTEKLHSDHPKAIGQLSNGHAYDMSSNIFERLPQVFFEISPDDGNDYIRILGRKDGKRAYMFIRRDYVNNVVNLDKYKIVMAKADGAAGTIGLPIPARVVGAPIIESPGTGTSESFISIGAFENGEHAKNALKYVQTKFARVLLGVLKVTQEITPDKWKYVPLQDFTSSSDIDWSGSVTIIDKQLYKKYNLSTDEINFIETYVKEMV